jgi:hypothetical protein
MTPGRRLRAWARRVCSEETMARLIDPVVADMQHETAEASGAHPARQLWVLTLSYFAFWRVVTCHLPLAATRRYWNSARARDRRALTLAALAFVAVTVLLVAPPAQHLPGRNNREQAWLFVLLLPQALTLSIPVALFVAALCALRARALTARLRRTSVVLALATSLLMFVSVNWLVPASNQAFRETLAGRYVLEGPAELSLADVRREALAFKRESRPRQAGRMLVNFHQRIAIAAAPLALTVLAFGLAGARGRVAALTAVSACGAFAMWLFAVGDMDRAMLGREWVAMALAWFPNVLLVATGLTAAFVSGGASSEPRDASQSAARRFRRALSRCCASRD